MYYLHLQFLKISNINYAKGNNLYVCKVCGTHLTALNQLISKAFQGSTGSAYLFNKVINIQCGQAQSKQLNTGAYVICDIFCIECQKLVGWKYIKAKKEDQKYKQGRYILEKALIQKDNWVD